MDGASKVPKSYRADSVWTCEEAKLLVFFFVGQGVLRYREGIKMYSPTKLAEEYILLLVYFGVLNFRSKCLEMFFYGKVIKWEGSDSLSISPH